MRRWPQLRCSPAGPTLDGQHRRPCLEISASRAGLGTDHGPWVETDCVLAGVAGNQFALGQDDSRRRFPEWTHELAWWATAYSLLVCLRRAATGVHWFCTHKLVEC